MAAIPDKELGIIASAIVDDAINNLQSLIDKLGEIPDSQSSKIDLIINDTELQTINAEIAGIDQSIDFTVNVDDTSLDTIKGDADTAASEVESIADAAGDADTALDGIDPTSLNEAASAAGALGDELNQTGNNAGNYSNSTDEATTSTNALGGAISGVAALGLGAFFSAAVDGAGNYIDSWNRLGLAVGEGGATIDQVQADWDGSIQSMQDTTGRGAGVIRQYITQMGIAGVTSKDAIVSSFDGVAGAAYVTGQSVESITNAFQRVVSTGTLGNRQLMALGLNSTDIYKYTGITVDQVNDKLSTMDANQRAAFLSQIMNAKYGADANEKYKQSWQYVVDVLGRAYDYLSRVIGGLLLPVAIPVLEAVAGALEQVAGYIEGLDGPMKTVASIIAVAVAGFLMLITTLGAVKTVLDLLNIQWAVNAARQTVSTAATWLGVTAKGAETTAQTSAIGAAAAHATAIESDTAAVDLNTAATNTGLTAKIRDVATWVSSTGIRVAHAIATGVATAAQIAYSVAAGVATAAQWLLNIALNANPIGIVVIAIVALIAALIWLYQNNEWVRNGINLLWGVLQGLGNYILNIFAPIITFFSNLFKDPIGTILNLRQAVQDFIINALMMFMQLNVQLGVLLIQIGQNALNTITQFFGQIPSIIWNFLLETLSNFLNFQDQIIDYADSAGSGVINTITSYLSGLPGQVWDLFLQTLATIANFAGEAFNRAKAAGLNILNGIIDTVKNIPGQMYTYGQNILQGLIDGLKAKMGPFGDILQFITDHWPHSPPKTGPLTEITESGMRNWIGDIMDAGMDVMGNFNLNNVNTGLPDVSGATLPGSGNNGSNTIQVNVDLSNANIGDVSEAKKIGDTVGESTGDSLADKLKRQASNQGYSVTNSRR